MGRATTQKRLANLEAAARLRYESAVFAYFRRAELLLPAGDFPAWLARVSAGGDPSVGCPVDQELAALENYLHKCYSAMEKREVYR